MALFDPVLIVFQIIALQCFYYLAMGTLLGLFYAIFDIKVSLDYFFTSQYLDFISYVGWITSISVLLAAIVGYYPSLLLWIHAWFISISIWLIISTLLDTWLLLSHVLLCFQGIFTSDGRWKGKEMRWFHFYAVFCARYHLLFLLQGTSPRWLNPSHILLPSYSTLALLLLLLLALLLLPLLFLLLLMWMLRCVVRAVDPSGVGVVDGACGGLCDHGLIGRVHLLTRRARGHPTLQPQLAPNQHPLADA